MPDARIESLNQAEVQWIGDHLNDLAARRQEADRYRGTRSSDVGRIKGGRTRLLKGAAPARGGSHGA